jgi:hypothetical protein
MKNLRKFLVQSVLYFIVVLILVSCSKKISPFNYIPNDATFVATIEIKNLIEKGKLNDFKTTNSYNLIKKFISYGDTKIEKLYDQLIENPSITGIDFKKELLIFNTSGNNNTVLLISLSSQEKFETFLSNMKKDFSLPVEIKKNKDISFFIPGKDLIMGWNSSCLFILQSQKNYSEAEQENLLIDLFTPKTDNSILNNTDFKAFYNEKKDINFWLSSSIISDSTIQKDLETSLGFDLKDNYLHAYLDFAKEDVNIYAAFISSDKVKKKINSPEYLKDGISSDLQKTIPYEKSLAILSFAFNPEKYLELIKDYSVKDTNKSFNLFSFIDLTPIEEIFHILGGDIVFTFNGIKYSEPSISSGSSTIPLFSAYLTINDPVKFKEIEDNLIKEYFKNNNKNIYYDNDIIINNPDYSIYFGSNNNCLIITNDEVSYNFFKNPIDSESISTSDLGPKLKTSPVFLYTNLDYNDYTEDLKNFIKNKLDAIGSFGIYRSVSSIYDYLTIETTKDNKTHIKIHLQNTKENSLYTVLHNIDQVIAEKVNF